MDPETCMVETLAEDVEGMIAFDTWRSSACEHEEMEIVSVRLGNWASVRRFEATLLHYARALCPLLLSEWVGIRNDGSVPAELSAQILVELDVLDQMTVDVVYLREPNGTTWRQIGPADIQTGWAWVARGEDYEVHVIDMSGDMTVVVDGRAVARVANLTSYGRWPHQSIVVPGFSETRRVQDDTPRAMPHAITSEHGQVPLAAYAGGRLGDLRALFAASVSTGNPVCWT
ncbi:MAG: hypothetical protein QM658_04830 [Gordonia sp. (in: high G+C Gram-positive bacteria)]